MTHSLDVVQATSGKPDRSQVAEIRTALNRFIERLARAVANRILREHIGDRTRASGPQSRPATPG